MNGITVVYDGECPFCKSYVSLMALRKSAGNVSLVDARTTNPIVCKLIDAGYDLNEGMAAIYGDRIYYGSDAVALISSMTDTGNILGRLFAMILRSPARAKLIYPLMKLGRRVVLALLGKKRI